MTPTIEQLKAMRAALVEASKSPRRLPGTESAYALVDRELRRQTDAKVPLCVICHENPISPEEGFDTCGSCARRT